MPGNDILKLWDKNEYSSVYLTGGDVMKTTQLIVNQKGFTLIELMVVAVVLAIISAIAVPIYTAYREEAETQEAYATLDQVAGACIDRAIKAVETGVVGGVPTGAVTAPAAGQYFTYGIGSGCKNAGGTFTATGKTGTAVAGKTLTVAVSFTGTPASTPVKTWGGALY